MKRSYGAVLVTVSTASKYEYHSKKKPLHYTSQLNNTPSCQTRKTTQQGHSLITIISVIVTKHSHRHIPSSSLSLLSSLLCFRSREKPPGTQNYLQPTLLLSSVHSSHTILDATRLLSFSQTALTQVLKHQILYKQLL